MVTGITTTSWTLENLARVVWTVTVTGKDGAGKAIVQGGTSVDLSTSATQTSTVTLQYLTQGTGSGTIHLSLDLSEAPTTPDSVTLALTDPMGVTTHPVITLNGTTASFTLDPAPVGAYSVYFFVEAGTRSAGKFESVMVFQNVDTAATLKFLGGDFDSTFHPVTGLSLSSSGLQLYTNNVSASLTATVAPTNATNPSVAWTSSDTSVATVSQAGLVVPKAVGTTTVTVTTGEGSFTASCEVTVSVKHVVSVSVTPVNLTLVQEGSTALLTAAINPADASDTTFTWSTSDATVATVNSQGVVTPLVAGTTTITATSTDGAKKGTSAVTVLPNGVSIGDTKIVTPSATSIMISGRRLVSSTGPFPLYSADFDSGVLSGHWLVDGIVVPGETGPTFQAPALAPGRHHFAFIATDSQGLASSASISVVYRSVGVVTYLGNGATAGSVPVDDMVREGPFTLLSQGTLVKAGSSFLGWSLDPDGIGGTFVADDSIFVIGAKNANLYAQWSGTEVSPVSSLDINGVRSTILREDGTLWFAGKWGAGGMGYVDPPGGAVAGAQQLIPVKAMKGVQSATLGYSWDQFVIKTDKTLWGRGDNYLGSLGDGTTETRSLPVSIMDNVSQVAASGLVTLILREDGTLWATGDNRTGQYGDGSSSGQLSPVQVGLPPIE